MGRRLVDPEASAVRLRTVLGAGQRPDRLAALDATLRAVGRYCHEQGAPSRAGPHHDRRTGDRPGVGSAHRRAPVWFRRCPRPLDGRPGLRPPRPSDHPCPYPAVVSLGSTVEGELLLVDVEHSRVLGVASEDAELRRSSMAAMAVELACAPWSAEASIVVCGTGRRAGSARRRRPGPGVAGRTDGDRPGAVAGESSPRCPRCRVGADATGRPRPGGRRRTGGAVPARREPVGGGQGARRTPRG